MIKSNEVLSNGSDLPTPARTLVRNLDLLYFEPHAKGNYIELIHTELKNRQFDFRSLNLTGVDSVEQWTSATGDSPCVIIVPSETQEEWLEILDVFCATRGGISIAVVREDAEEAIKTQLPQKLTLIDFSPEDAGVSMLFNQLELHLTGEVEVLEAPAKRQTKLEHLEDTIKVAIHEAEQGLVPRDLINEGKKIAGSKEKKDRLRFLEILSDFARVNIFRPAEFEFREMLYVADELAQVGAKVVVAFADAACEIHPTSADLEESLIFRLSHSSFAEDRERARRLVAEMFQCEGETFDLPEEYSFHNPKAVKCLAYLLDAYHVEGRHDQALEVTEKLYDKFKESTVVLRNHARAMERMPLQYPLNQVLEMYRRAMNVKAPDDTSAAWLADTFSKNGMRLQAIQARILACMLDLNDAKCFAMLALEIANSLMPSNVYKYDPSDAISSDFPAETINEKLVLDILVHVFEISLASVPIKVDVICESAMRKMDIPREEVDKRLQELGPQTGRSRREFILALCEAVDAKACVRTPFCDSSATSNTQGETL